MTRCLNTYTLCLLISRQSPLSTKKHNLLFANLFILHICIIYVNFILSYSLCFAYFVAYLSCHMFICCCCRLPCALYIVYHKTYNRYPCQILNSIALTCMLLLFLWNRKLLYLLIEIFVFLELFLYILFCSCLYFLVCSIGYQYFGLLGRSINLLHHYHPIS